MHLALRDAVPDGVSLKHTFQRLLVQAETTASTIRGVCTFGLLTEQGAALSDEVEKDECCTTAIVVALVVCDPWEDICDAREYSGCGKEDTSVTRTSG